MKYMIDKNFTVNISTKTLLKILALSLLIFFLFLIKEVLAVLFISLVFAAAFDPWLDRMKSFKIPRPVGILIIYLVVFGGLSLIAYLILPPLSEQMRTLVTELPTYYEDLAKLWAAIQGETPQNAQTVVQSVQEYFQSLTPQLFTVAGNFVGSITAIVGVLVLTFYLTVEESAIKTFVRSVVPTRYQPYTIQKVNQIQTRLGRWIRGQLILSLIIGVFSYIGLLLIGVKFALVLALIAGVSELIPLIGPIIGAIPAVFFAFTQSPVKALFVVVLYVIIQQLENNIIVPKVMEKTVGLNPIAVLLVLLIGAKLGGVVGLLLAVPTATILAIFIDDFIEGKREREERLEA